MRSNNTCYQRFGPPGQIGQQRTSLDEFQYFISQNGYGFSKHKSVQISIKVSLFFSEKENGEERSTVGTTTTSVTGPKA